MWKTISEGGAAVEEAVKQLLPPCQIKCPIKEDIQRTNVLLSLLPHDPAEAKEGVLQIGEYLYTTNPLFSICGYVCGLCELECNYAARGGAVRRRLLKRFIADTYMNFLPDKEEFDLVKDKENIAVVGGGPAGLMCAFELSKRGYKVTIFEASDRLGGALWLIPSYRLPYGLLQVTLDNLVRIAGIDVKFQTKVGEGRLDLEKLRKQGFRAVFIAEGTPTPRVLTFAGREVKGQDLSGVMYGQMFLYEMSHGNLTGDYFAGKRVIVVGGGNVAFDVARSARRMGGDTVVVALECEDKESRDGIPADEEEITGAWEEGVRILYSRGVNRIIGQSGKFTAIECPRCETVYDDTGFNPRFDMSDTKKIDGDVLIITVGQGPERVFLEQEGLLDERGWLAVDPVSLQSLKKEWIFIGGDIRRVGYMADAMKDGIEAAESVERYLRGIPLKMGRVRHFESLTTPQRHDYKSEPEVIWIPPEKRMHFQLFERGFTLEEAIEEAKRCLRCGPCASCKACISIDLQENLPTIEVDTNMCCGCGICVSACGYGAAYLKESGGVVQSDSDILKCKACGMCVSACPSQARELVGSMLDGRVAEVLGNL